MSVTQTGTVVLERLGTPDVGLDEELARALGALVGGVRPSALVTSGSARLSPFLDALVRSAGTSWFLRDGDGGDRDAVTGSRVASVEDAAGPRFVDPARLVDRCRDALVVESVMRWRATDSVRVGSVAERTLQLLGLPSPVVWGTTEPLARPWSTDAVTQAARSAMPTPPVLLASGEAFCWIGVRRTERGLTESTRVLVPPDLVPTSLETAIGTVADVLARAFQLELATVLLHPTDDEGHRPAGRAAASRPLAAVLGPRVVRETGAPAADQDGVQVSTIGRGKLPSRLYRFDDVPRSWERLVDVARAVVEGVPGATTTEP